MSDFDDYVRRDGKTYGHAFAALLPRGYAWTVDVGSTLFKVFWGLGDFVARLDARIGDFLEKESFPGTAEETIADWERVAGIPEPCALVPDPVPAVKETHVVEIAGHTVEIAGHTVEIDEIHYVPYVAPLADRQKAVRAKFAATGGQSIAYFQEVAAQLGWDLVVEEFSPFCCGISECGWSPASLLADGARFHWRVPFPRGTQVPFECGVTGCGYPLTDFTGGPDPSRLTWFETGAAECGDRLLDIDFYQPLHCMLMRRKPSHTVLIFDYCEVDHRVWHPDTTETEKWSHEI